MNRVIAVFVTSIILIVVLLSAAFLFVVSMNRKGLEYDIFINDQPAGTFRIFRYITEDKVIFKGTADYTYSTGYPSLNEKLFLKRRTMLPIKFVSDTKGRSGDGRLISLIQTGEKTDYVYIERPEFFTMKAFETGEKTSIFSPHNLMLYMPILEKYNYWKKGAQFFEIMIPVNAPVPLMRDKLKVNYVGDEYIPILGRRVESERFTLSGSGIPEADISLSKYGHVILSLNLKETNTRFVLSSYLDTPWDKMRQVYKNIKVFIMQKVQPDKGQYSTMTGEELAENADDIIEAEAQSAAPVDPGMIDITFDNKDLVLSGRLYLPSGKKPSPAILLVPEDGPLTNGVKYLLDSYGKALASYGYTVMSYDMPGRGKSHGNYKDLDDELIINTIRSAVVFLEDHPSVDNSVKAIIGVRGGGYLALKAMKSLPDVGSCVIIGIPSGTVISGYPDEISVEKIASFLNAQGFKRFDNAYMKTVLKELRRQLTDIIGSDIHERSFLNEKVPLKASRDLIARQVYKTILSCDRPVLVVSGKNETAQRKAIPKELKNDLKEAGERVTLAVFRNLHEYLGVIKREGYSTVFYPEEDVLALIRNWLRDIPKKKPVQPQII